MSTTTIATILLLGVSSAADLECSATKYSYVGVDLIYPNNVCYSSKSTAYGQTSEVSYQYICSGGQPYLTTYSNTGCSGSPQSQQNIQDTYGAFSGFEMENGCGKAPCDYVTIRSWVSVSTGCDTSNSDTSTFSGWSEVPYISNHCSGAAISSYQYVCEKSNGTAAYEIYSGNTNCEGDPTTIYHYDLSASVTCDDSNGVGAASVSITVDCGTAGAGQSKFALGFMVYVILLWMYSIL